jgi:hypothetical protein
MKNAIISKNTYPSIINPEAGMVLVTEWKVGDKKDQRKVADASLDNIGNGFWPDGLLTYYTYLGTDGETILHYSHWRHERDHIRFMEQGLPKRLDDLLKEVQIKDRNMLGKFRIYRTMPGDSTVTPGCIVIIREEFESPELTSDWIDTVIDALASENQLPEGGLSAYFHISLDGKSMLNYAEWASEQAHQNAMDRSDRGTIGLSPLWDRVLDFPGRLHNSSVKRYKFYKGLVADKSKNG